MHPGGIGGASRSARRRESCAWHGGGNWAHVVKTIDLEQLAIVTGGMRLDPNEVAQIEDRRGMSYRQSRRQRQPLPPPLQRPPREPGDLASQAGIDDIGRHRRRR